MKNSQLVSFVIGIGFVTFPAILLSIIDMCKGNFDTSTWFFYPKMVVPFSTETVFGWYVRLIFDNYGGWSYALTIVTIIAYLVGCCTYIGALCEHFRTIIRECDELVNNYGHDKGKHNEIFTEKLKLAVSLHVNIFE